VPLVALWAPLVAGAKVIIPEAEDASDGARVNQLVKAEGVTLLHASPEGWQELIDSGLRSGRSLRALSSGGALSEELAEEILARCRVLWNVYGSAETAGCATLGRIEPPSPVGIGRPISNMRIYVVDEGGGPVPIGAVGELLIAGDGVATGYVNQPELNDAAFVEAPPEDGRVFRSGDSGRWLAEGVLQLVTPVST
jgi:non-ribosomal peptide synthetase component F